MEILNIIIIASFILALVVVYFKFIKKEDFYIADVIYSRFNLNDENLFTGNTLYEFKKTNDGWKMVSLEGITDFES